MAALSADAASFYRENRYYAPVRALSRSEAADFRGALVPRLCDSFVSKLASGKSHSNSRRRASAQSSSGNKPL